MAKTRVLIVDYEPKLIDRYKSFFSEDRFEISTAKDGLAALEVFDEFHPDLVMLRTMLPKKHGFQVCQEMVTRSGSRRIPIIMHCSIYKSRKYRNDAMKIYGASEYVEDPIDGKVLRDLLDRFMPKDAVAVEPVATEKEPSVPAAAQEEAAHPEPSAPVAPVAPAAPVKPRKKKSVSAMDRALEDTLSGLNLGKKKKKTPKVEETVAVTPSVAPGADEDKAVEEPAPEPPEAEEVTSEELFGDVISDVEEEDKAIEEMAVPPSPPEETKPEPEPEPEPTEKEQQSEPVAETPPIVEKKAKTPEIDVESALGSGILHPKGMSGDTGVKRLQKKTEKELDKKLEETLAGVHLGPKKKKVKPEKQVEEKPPEVPTPEEASPVSPEAKVEEPVADKKESVAVEEKAPVEKAEEAPQKELEKKAAEEPAEKSEEAEVPEIEKEKPVEEEVVEGVEYGNYILMDKIAMGGMAELFKARQNGVEGFKRIVAVKRILPHLAANEEFVTMFTDEAKLAAQLNHPNIGHIYELGKIEDSYFIAMEYVEGRDLRAILKEVGKEEKKVPFRVATYISQKICSALDYAHKAKDADGKSMDLVHRDVSPQNVIISTNGEVKLVDFGIAKAVSKASHTQSGALKGKLLYMSPEQAWGKDIDGRADIFALGVVFWELLTGRKLFYGDSEMSILEKVREAVVEPVSKYREDVPEELERIVLKSLEKDPSKRYRTCKAMLTDLERFSYKEWQTLPAPYDAVSFLQGFFPNVYKLEALEGAGAEAEVAPVEAAPVVEEPKKVVEAPEVPVEKVKTKEPAGKAPAGKKKKGGGKKSEPSAPGKEQKVQPAPKPEPVPPKAEESAGMFGEFVQKGEKANKKPMLIVAGVIVVLIVIVGLFFVPKGKKKPPAPSPKKPVVEKPKPVEEKQPEETPPKEKKVVETPAEPTAQETSARKAAGAALTAFNKKMNAVNVDDASKYAPADWSSIQKNWRSLNSEIRRAGTAAGFKKVRARVDRESLRIDRMLKKIEDAKAAEAALAEEKAREEAAKKAKAEAEKKAAEKAAKEKAAKEAAAKKTKPGDFIPLWAVDVRPKTIKTKKVEYTAMARRNRVQGTFYIEVSIDETGKVTDAKILRGPKPNYGLGQACLKAAKASTYTPAIKDGVPVKTKMTYPVKFTM